MSVYFFITLAVVRGKKMGHFYDLKQLETCIYFHYQLEVYTCTQLESGSLQSYPTKHSSYKKYCHPPLPPTAYIFASQNDSCFPHTFPYSSNDGVTHTYVRT